MTNLEIYLQGWLKMWPLLAAFILLGVWTSISERRDKRELEKANKRHSA